MAIVLCKGTMIKDWAFARGGAWRNPKPTGGRSLSASNAAWMPASGNDGTLTTEAVTTIELTPMDVCAECGVRLLEELEAKDQA